MRDGSIELRVREQSTGALAIVCDAWPGFQLEGLTPALRSDGEERAVESCRVCTASAEGRLALEYAFSGNLSLTLMFEPWPDGGVRLRATLRNGGGHGVTLNHATLLASRPGDASIAFGHRRESVRIMEQSSYCGKVRPLVTPADDAATASAGEPNTATVARKTTTASELVWLAYDRAAHRGFLAGFLSSERWLGHVAMDASPDGTVARWSICFDGADVLVKPQHEIGLEDALFLTGPDPWKLLERYADAVGAVHRPPVPAHPPVTWCSWYPYRLGVTEERLLETARIAARRLKPLGLSVIEVDLGWEEGNLPSAFRENERFSHGLKWLSEQLAGLGFDLGVWKAPFSISEYDPIVREHPEYLIHDADGRPAPHGEWFWAPHGKVYILDLTHPGARQWLKAQMTSLAERGVRYFKADFIGCVSLHLAKRRYDTEIAAGGGTEAARLGAEIIRAALPVDALILNCGGPELPGSGQWPLLYACQDTGNTGFVSHQFQRMNYHALACHLYKNGRWGVIQPSCLCVGGPGSIEDARLRATIAFLSGGQIDISDTLTTLPEDRWAVLTATLPPLGLTAKPVDLFDPLYATSLDYTGTCQGESATETHPRELPPGSVWKVHVATAWDEWDLIGIFSYQEGSSAQKPEVARFAIPFSMLDIPASETRWAYEFWSGQFLGFVPGKRVNPGGYVHPGDFQDLTVGDAAGVLDIAFFGPGVRLLCLRRERPHPWVVGTSFHQSGGAELERVEWDPVAHELRGELCRPRGETGFVAIADAGFTPTGAIVDGREAPLRAGSQGSLLLPLVATGAPVRWSLRFTS